MVHAGAATGVPVGPLSTDLGDPEAVPYFLWDEPMTVRELQARLAGASEPERARLLGKPLRCPVCGHDQFWKRWTLMNTPGLTFFGVEWANRQAENLVCAACGHVLWFLRE